MGVPPGPLAGLTPLHWRILAIPVALLVLLAGATLLSAQVEGDLHAAIAPSKPLTPPPPPDDTPLKLNGFKLPRDLPVTLPAGANVSADLSKIELPRDTNLTLPKGLGLDNLSFGLPRNMSLDLPAGSRFDASRLTLPKGGDVTLPSGDKLHLPPGAHLDLPPEVAQQLLEQGLPAGALLASGHYDLQDIPPGLLAGVGVPALDDVGTIRLPSGTTILLPVKAPLAPGVLVAAAPYLLPAGTTFDIPLEGGGRAQGSVGGVAPFPLPQTPQPPVDDGSGPVRVLTEITQLPASVRKGSPFTVGGYVVTAGSSRAVAGAPVDVFLNQTKGVPGPLVGQGTTDSLGRFSIQVTIPAGSATGRYQLVDHARAFSAGGVQYREGWGDPGLTVVSSTSLSLVAPAKAAAGQAVALSGRLVDEDGVGVVSAQVRILADGSVALFAITDGDGAYSAQLQLGAGTVHLQAVFDGTDSAYGSSSPVATVEVGSVTAIVVPLSAEVTRGQPYELAGTVVRDGQGVGGAVVDVIDPFNGDHAVQAASDGSFRYATTIPMKQPLGETSMTLTLGDGSALATESLTIVAGGRISLTAPPGGDPAQPVAFTARLDEVGGSTLGGIPLSATLSGPGGEVVGSGTTGADGTVTFRLTPSSPVEGEYRAMVWPAPTSRVNAAAATLSVRLAATSLSWDLPSTVLRGKTVTVSAIATRGGDPAPGVPVTLSLFGDRVATTDASGRATWSFAAPTNAPLGKTDVRLSGAGAPLQGSVRVQAIPHVSVEDASRLSEGVAARVHLTDDQGAPLAREPVSLSLAADGWSRRVDAVTDDAGGWNGTLDATGAPADGLTLTATHAQSGDYGPSAATQAVSVQPAGGGVSPWLLGAFCLGAAMAGGGGVLAWQRLRRRPAPAPTPEAAPAPVVTATPSVGLALRLDLAPEEPQVWGLGEARTLFVEPAGAPRPGARIEVEHEGQTAALVLDAEGAGRVTLTATREGEARILAHLADDPAARPAELRVRIVDYRKAISEEFDRLVARASLSTRATPREVEARLAARLGDDPAIGEAMALVEIANYSTRPIVRADLVRLSRLCERVASLLDGRR